MSSYEDITSVPAPLVRELALPTSTSPATRALDKPSSSSSPESTSTSGLSTCEDTSTGTDNKRTTRCKRKIPVTVASSKVAKKTRPSVSPPPTATEDSHQCSIVTVLSAESLCELQMDEDLGFVDEDQVSAHKRRKLDETLKFAPVPQAAK